MKTTIRNIGIAERNVINAVLNEIPPSKTNRALVRSIRRRFDIQGLQDEFNALRSSAIQKAMDEMLSANLIEALRKAMEKEKEGIPVGENVDEAIERIVRTVVGPQMFRTIKLSWDELLAAESGTTSYEVDDTDLKMFRIFYDKKEEWAWNDKKESVPPPSALHEALANLDEAIEEALEK